MFRLEEYDRLAKRRAIEQNVGGDRWVPVAWVDYDDVDHAVADGRASMILDALNGGASESDPVVVVADAVNQLAMVVEEVAFLTPGGRGDLADRCRELRGHLAELIPA